MKKILLSSVVALALVGCATTSAPEVAKTASNITIKDGVKMQKVDFQSKGVKLVGDVYFPQDYQADKKYPAVVVTGAWVTVKEQMPSNYATKLAKKGFITLVFDFRGWGESDGKERYLEDPERKTEDIIAAANYLRSRADVKSADVGGLGICASSGYMVKAYSQNKLKSIALVAPWLQNKQIAAQVYGGDEGVKKLIAISDKAQKDYDTNGKLDIITAASKIDKSSLMYNVPYYTEKNRGDIKAFDNKFNLASWRPWLTFDAIEYADKIPGKVLFVESEAMALPQGSKAFKAIAGDKVESVNLPKVTQFDFYDKPAPVATSVESVAKFFSKEL